MKLIRYIVFIPIIYMIISLIYILLPWSLFGLISLSNFWLTVLLIFFGGVAVSVFTLLPGAITWLSAKIAPNREFAFYSTLTISIILGILQIYGFWKNPNVTENSIGLFLGIMLTCLTIGFASSISFGAGVEMFEEKEFNLGIIAAIGTIVFYIGIIMAFCLLSTKICHVKPDKMYNWYFGIWHGIFVIPNWIVSLFSNDVLCKAQNSSTAYNVWWWLSFIFGGLGMLGGGNSRR